MFSHKIINYQHLIDKSTREFVGRMWVRKAVDDFLRADSPRIFLLLGEPGSGKTAFMADLVKRRSYSHHFIGRGSRADLAASLEWRDPIRFAESIGYQLLRDYGGWVMNWEDWGIHVRQNVKELKGRLTGARVEEFHASPRPADKPMLSAQQEVELLADPAAQVIGVFIEKYVMDIERIVLQLLFNPLRSVAERWPDRPLILVVDGLDEAAEYPTPEETADYSNPKIPKIDILKILTEVDLPSNVRFLTSSRPGKHLSRSFLGNTHQFWLSADKEDELNPLAINDARIYLRKLSKEALVSERLRARKTKPRDFVESIVAASAGNFLYLFHYAGGLRESLARSDETLLDLKALPQGLYGIYENFLRKISEPWGVRGRVDIIKPVLGTLAVAREPLSSMQIAEFSDVEQDMVGTLLEQITQFLDVTGRMRSSRYVIYHKSFADFLVSEDNEDSISSQRAHARIADYFLNAWGGLEGGLPLLAFPEKRQSSDNYGLRHLTSHLEDSGEAGVEQLHRLFSMERDDGRNAWAEAKADNDDISGYLADVMKAWKLVEKSSAVFVDMSTPAKSIGLEVRYALLATSVTSSIKRVSSLLLTHLVRAKIWSPSRALSHLRQFDAAIRVQVLGWLKPLIPDTLFRQAVEIESSAEDVDYYELNPELTYETSYSASLLKIYRDRFALLSGGAVFSERLIRVYRAKARHIKSDLKRALYLLAVSDYCPDSRKGAIMEEVCEAAQKMENKHEYASLMTILAPHHNETEALANQLLSAIEGCEFTTWSQDMLRSFDELSGGRFISGLHAFAIEDQRVFGARNAEAANQSTEQFAQWLLKMFNDNPKLLLDQIFSMLVELIPRLSKEQMRRLIAAVFGMHGSDNEKAETLALLIPELPKDLFPEVIQAAMAFQAEGVSFRVLAESIHYCSPQVQEAALKEAAIAIDNLTSAGNREVDEALEQESVDGKERWEQQHELEKQRGYWVESLSKLAANLPALNQEPFLKLIGHTEIGAGRARCDALLRLVPHLREPLLTEALDIAHAFTSAEERLRALNGILPFLSEPVKTRVHREALDLALSPDEGTALHYSIRGEGTFISTENEINFDRIAELAPYLSEDELKRILEKVLEISNSNTRHETLIRLAPWLPTPLLREVLEEVQAISDAVAQAELLAACAARLLEAGHKQEALKITRSIKDKFILTQALLHAATHFSTELSEGLRAEAQAAARTIDAGYYRRRGDLPLECRATALADIAGEMPAPARRDLLAEAVRSEMSASEHSWHDITLVELCGRLSKLGFPKEALETADAVRDTYRHAEAIVATAQHAPESLLREVLTIASAIEDQQLQARVLSELASILPEHLRTEAFQIASSLLDEREKMIALTRFIPFLPPQQGEEIENNALSLLSKTEDSVDKVYLVAFLADNCSERIKAEVLELGLNTIRRLQESQDRAHSAASLVPHLSKSQLRELLEIIQETKDSYWRGSALVDASARVAELLRPKQALDQVHNMESKASRAQALQAIAGYLDEQLLRDALRITSTLHPSTQRFYRDDEVLRVSEGWSQEKRFVSWPPQVAAFSALAPNEPPGFRAEVYIMWQEILRRIATEDRKDSLTQLGMLSSVLDRQGGAESLIECARAVQDAARWWP